ncbi:MAG: CCDC90 family protein [Rhodoferax sp.]|nr:CCDC90 family protein [Rhodoferax sp.]
MSTITFDTQALVQELQASGLPAEQAQAVVRAIVKSHDGLVTKADLDRLEAKIDGKFAVIDAKFDKMTWMISVLIAIAVANFAKQFF